MHRRLFGLSCSTSILGLGRNRELVSSLHLDPGPADAALWVMNDGSRSIDIGET